MRDSAAAVHEKERLAVADRVRALELNQCLTEEAAKLRSGAERHAAEVARLASAEAATRLAAERHGSAAALLRE